MLRLAELEPEFIKIIDERSHRPCELSEADGLFFLCPVCFTKNGGPVGTHGIILWRPHVPKERSPKAGRWEFVGTGIEDLSLVAGSSSILLVTGPSGCGAHFFIRNGGVDLA